MQTNKPTTCNVIPVSKTFHLTLLSKSYLTEKFLKATYNVLFTYICFIINS